MELEPGQDMKPKVTQTRLDKALAYIAPGLARSRMRARAGLASDAARGYEGGSSKSRFEDWYTGGGSANAEIEADGDTQRNRARALVRDEGYMCAAVDTLEEKVIGTGLQLQIEGGGHDKFQAAYEAWSSSTECDAEGVLSLAGMAGLTVRGNCEAGESLLRKRPRKASDGLTVPLQLQFLEADFVDASKDEPSRKGGGKIVQGVHFNGLGKRIGYQLFKDHPGDSTWIGDTSSKFYPVKDVAHVFKMKRGGQARGVTQMHALIALMKSYTGFKDARAVQAFVAACFAGVLHTDDVGDGEINPYSGFETQKLQPGTMMRVPDGLGVTFPTPPGFQDASGHERSILLTAAKCMWLTYEELTGDYSGVNYSSGRMGHIAVEGLRRAYRKHVLIPLFYDRVLGWFRDAYYLKTGDATTGLVHSWAQPRRQMVDPNKETEAKLLAIRGGLTSLQQTLREEGESIERVVEQRAEDKARFENAGLLVPWEQPEKADKPPKTD
jgi:lambda family phage portal protein